MANYRAVKGLTIQVVSSDPPNPVSGQIWYNSTLGKIKAASVSGWATGGNLNTARAAGIGAGTQTAALHISGNPDRTIVEAYDGSSWSEGPDLNALIFPKVELYQTCPATGLLGSLETV